MRAFVWGGLFLAESCTESHQLFSQEQSMECH